MEKNNIELFLKGMLLVFLVEKIIYFVYQLTKTATILFTAALDIWPYIFCLFLLFVFVIEYKILRNISKVKLIFLMVAAIVFSLLNFGLNIFESYLYVEKNIDYLHVVSIENPMGFLPPRIFQIHLLVLIIYTSVYLLKKNNSNKMVV